MRDTMVSRKNNAGANSTLRPSPVIRRRSSVRRIAMWLLLFLGVYVGMAAAIAWGTLKPKPSSMTTTPARNGMRFEAVRFQSADGTPLAGWLVPAAHPKGLVILCHGVDSTRLAMLQPALMLHNHGYSTLLFDFRTRGESGGSLCTIGYRETEDLLAAVKFVRERPETRDLPKGVMGESMGAAVAIMGAARCPEIRAVVAESPFARLDHALDNHFRMVFGRGSGLMAWPVRFIGERLIGCSCCDVSPLAEVSRISPRPLLLIQDGADRLCPPAETERLLEAAGEPKHLWTVPGADHIMAHYTQPAEFERRVVAFFNSSL